MNLTLNQDQIKVSKEAYHEARNFGASPREMKALGEALWVESKSQNLNYGDRDSRGPLQQRPSQGWLHPNNVKLAVRDFLTHARANRGVQGSAGVLAQSVQRSAFPGRYDAAASAANLLQQHGDGGSSSSYRSILNTAVPGQVHTETQTIDDPEARNRVALAQHLQRTDPGSMLLRLGVVDPAEPVTKQVTKRTIIGTPAGGLDLGAHGNHPNDSSTNGVISRLVSRANTINSKHLPYQWGGGHAGKVNPRTTGPLDCSGAVSAVLGVNPRVASQFEKWGSAGRGKRLTIYAKGDHTIMEIDGHFFGTSHENPGGGAGWIPHEKVSKQYLAQFVARHPQGM